MGLWGEGLGNLLHLGRWLHHYGLLGHHLAEREEFIRGDVYSWGEEISLRHKFIHVHQGLSQGKDYVYGDGV